jgi:hypothetical protein
VRASGPVRHLYQAVIVMSITTGSSGADPLYDGLPTGPGLIAQDRDGRVYVAANDDTVESRSRGILIRTGTDDSDHWDVVLEGRIKGLQIAPDGDAWVATDEKILRYPRTPGSAAVSRTASFQPMGSPGSLLATRAGEIWCAGCASVRRGDAKFEIAPVTPEGWTVTPSCDDPFGNVWAVATDGARLDLAVLSQQQPHLWQLLDLPADRIGGDWRGMVADDAGFVWLALESALLRADPRSKSGHRPFANPVDVKITAIARAGGRQIVVGFADGSVRELTVNADEPPTWQSIRNAGAGPVQALYHDRSGMLWVLSGGRVERIGGLKSPWHAHWDQQPHMPAGNHDHIFARVGDRLYTAGGKSFFGWPASEWVNLDHVWSYEVPSGTWRVEAPMLEPGKAYSGIAPLNGQIWLLGGLFRDGGGTRATSTVEIFDPATRRFRLGPELPRAAGQVVALTVGDRLYAIGGGGDEGSSAQTLSIGAGETTWRIDAPAPAPVTQASGCVLKGRIYIAAGRTSKCPGLFVYDPKLDSWDTVERQTPAPNAPLCTAFDDMVWVMGGRGPDGGQTSSWAYSPDTGKWIQGPDIPLPVSWAAAADVDGRLLIAGGAYNEARVGSYFNSDRVFLLRQD